jgi:hypothetical protein
MFRRRDDKDELGQLYYDKQSDIVSAALKHPGQPLNELLRLMRHNGMGSLYLAGRRLDSQFSFGSDEVGLAVSALPEDGLKAAVPGYHPGSTEVYVVFQGSLVLELLSGSSVKDVLCTQYTAQVIPPGVCHRVRLQPDTTASSLIVKTHLKFEPVVQRCTDCGYFDEPAKCPLHLAWSKECENW